MNEPKSLSRRMRSLLNTLVEGKREYGRLQAAMVELVQQAASNERVCSLLDVGCGQGNYTQSYASAAMVPSHRVYGVDFNPAHIEVAQGRLTAHLLDLEGERLPFEDISMDLVVCNQVLEHLKNIFWALSEMDRVLSIGGVLIIGIPNLTSLVNRPILSLGLQPVTIGIEGPHVRGFAHVSFRRFLLRHTGYHLVTEVGSSLYPLPARLGAERLARHLPGLSAYTFYALKKRRIVAPCPWLQFGADGETSYTHVEIEGSFEVPNGG